MASEYTVAYLATRFLAAVSSLLLVRLLSKNEYGLYTLLLTAFTFICTFSDLGATETLSFFRRRAIKKNKLWMQYFSAVIQFRLTLFIFGFVLACIYVFSTGHHLGVQTQNLFLGATFIGFGAWFAIQSGINSYVLKLEQCFRAAYAAELSSEGTKLLGVCIIWVFGLTTALFGITSVSLGAFVAAMVSLRLLGHNRLKHLQVTKQRANRNMRILLGQILPVLPGIVLFALQGPLVVYLASYYGSAENLAEVGALGRLGAILGMITGFTGTVVVPRIIAISDNAIFIKRYLQWWLVSISWGIAVMLTVLVFPHVILLLLGETYAGLHTELTVLAATTIIWGWNGYVFILNRARGWIKNQKYILLVLTLGQFSMFIYLDFSTTLNVLLFGLGTAFLWFFFQLGVNIIGLLNSEYDTKN